MTIHLLAFVPGRLLRYLHIPARRRSLPIFSLCLVALLAACQNPVQLGDDEDHVDEIAGVTIEGVDGQVYATFEEDGWSIASGDAFEIAAGDVLPVKITFLAEDGDRFEIPPSGSDHTLDVEIADGAILGYPASDGSAAFVGLAPGSTTARVQILHGGHPDYATAPLPFRIRSRM